MRWLLMFIAGNTMANEVTDDAPVGLSMERAQRWSDFESAYQVFPCQDGWAGCVVSGSPVDPETGVNDGVGPHGLGWFSLEPTATFSPFAELSEYEQVREVLADLEASLKTRDVGGHREPLNLQPTTEPKTKPVLVASSAPSVSVPVVSKPPMVSTPELLEPLPQPSVNPPKLPAVAFKTGVSVEATDADCSSLSALETAALGGLLSKEVQVCLERRIEEEPQTIQDRASRLLMVQATSTNDEEAWAALAFRHLSTISYSDPDLCYRYALHLSEKPGNEVQVIRYSNRAMENKHQWGPEVYTSRVSSVHSLRTKAALALWEAETNRVSTSPELTDYKKVEAYRNLTKTLAREWMDYNQSSGNTAELAHQICSSAAGTGAYCGG